MAEALIVAAGMVNASFTRPLKRMRNWPWEKAWLIWTITALVLFPLIAVLLTIPHLASAYIEADQVSLLKICFYGMCWGTSQALFGLSIESIGVALGFSIVLGVSAAMGTLIPFVRLHHAMPLQQMGAMLFSGLGLVVFCVSFRARAGRRREQELDSRLSLGKGSFKLGLAFAIANGMLASMMHLGISFGAPLLKVAAEHGANSLWCTNVMWPPLLAADAVTNILYCLYLSRKQRPFAQYPENNPVHC